MMRLFKFDSLVTPSIIKVVFYIGVAISVLAALSVIASGLKIMTSLPVLGLGYIVGGLILVLLGIIGSRIGTEMILVMFMIRDELAWQRQQRQEQVAGPAE